MVLQGGSWRPPQSKSGAHFSGACSCRHSGLWKPFLTGSAFSPMGMSTWRCLPRTCLPAVASSVGKGESEAALPTSAAQEPRPLGMASLGRQELRAPWDGSDTSSGQVVIFCQNTVGAGPSVTTALWEVPKTKLAPQGWLWRWGLSKTGGVRIHG